MADKSQLRLTAAHSPQDQNRMKNGDEANSYFLSIYYTRAKENGTLRRPNKTQTFVTDTTSAILLHAAKCNIASVRVPVICHFSDKFRPSHLSLTIFIFSPLAFLSFILNSFVGSRHICAKSYTADSWMIN